MSDVKCLKCKFEECPVEAFPCVACIYNDFSSGEKDMFEEGIDVVNHPKHYCRDGAMECIDEMVEIFGITATMNFCKLNAWKYRYRAADKNGEEDLQKSDWYIRKYTELKKRRKESGEL